MVGERRAQARQAERRGHRRRPRRATSTAAPAIQARRIAEPAAASTSRRSRPRRTAAARCGAHHVATDDRRADGPSATNTPTRTRARPAAMSRAAAPARPPAGSREPQHDRQLVDPHRVGPRARRARSERPCVRSSSWARPAVECSEYSGSPVTSASMRDPHHRRDHRERQVAQARAVVGAGQTHHSQYTPLSTHASGRSSPAAASSSEHQRPAPGAFDLEHDRPHDQRDVGDVEIALRGEVLDEEAAEHEQAGEHPHDRAEAQPARAGRCRRRAATNETIEPSTISRAPPCPKTEQTIPKAIASGCSVGAAVDAEVRQVQVQQVATPQQRVEGVVGRVCGEREVADQRAHAQHRQRDCAHVGRHRAQPRQPERARRRPGVRRAFHAGPLALPRVGHRLRRAAAQCASTAGPSALWDTGEAKCRTQRNNRR